MAQEQRLELRLSQKLILTPQLQQSIKLLQLPILELSQDINQELMNNPLLEEGTDNRNDREAEPSDSRLDEDGFKEPVSDMETPLEKLFGYTSDNYFEERESDGRDLGYFNDQQEEMLSPFERNRSKDSLYDHLLWQLRLSHTTENTRQTAEIIINSLNEDGYLKSTVEEMAALAKIDLDTAQEALTLIQSLDPAGVGARDLQECLLLQLEPLNLKASLVEKILLDGFSELETKKYKQLATRFESTLDEIIEAIKIIERLEPRPGRNYSSDEILHIIPDVYVEESE
nr:RNA polymerase sigma-54 factor [bacterium]